MSKTDGEPPSSGMTTDELNTADAVTTANTKNTEQNTETLKYADGHHSIEHQLDIHVRDLVESPDQVASVLEGLRYLIDYRLVNRRYPHMDYELMRRVALALLEQTGKREGGGGSAFAMMMRRGRRASAEADAALTIFRDLLREVDEFAEAVGRMPVAELRRKLELHCRLVDTDSEVMKAVAVDVIHLLARQPQFADWRDLFKPERIQEVSVVLQQYTNSNTVGGVSTRKATLYPPQSLYFDRSVERVLDMFAVKEETGLSSQEHQQRLEYYNSNTLPQPPEKQWWRMLFEQVNDFMIYLLIVAAVLSPIIEPDDLVSPVVLLIVIVINVTIGFVQEQRASKALSALLNMQVPKARCRRDNHDFQQIPAESLVPGDIVSLQEGDSVPADLRLIKAYRLEVVESWLTGESVPVAKQTAAMRMGSRRVPLQKCKNCAFMGTVVARGTAVGVVVRTGVRTEMGVVSQALYESSDQQTTTASPLQQELKSLGVWLVLIAVSLCVLIVAVGSLNKQPFKEMLHYGLNLAVSVIPEGLVAVVTVAMALAVGRMAAQNAIVRKLPAVETLGAVSVICTDKTGTVTEGVMRVEAVACEDLAMAYTVCALCNNSVVVVVDGGGGGKTVAGADTTETALQQAALTNGFDKTELLGRYKKMIEIPFDSERKMMSILLWPTSNGSTTNNGVLMAKGAPEVILQKCTHYKTDKTVVPMNEEKLQELAGTQSQWSDRGWRVLALAVGSVDLSDDDVTVKYFTNDTSADVFDNLAADFEQQLTFIGLIALVDPPRHNIASAIADCHRAGIQVVMITGDHPATAAAIARHVGIKHDAVLRGREVDILGEQGLCEMAVIPNVFARVSPQNKLCIVKALQARGLVTAMTGDGVNDAPAIKRADIGIAMGIAGTDLAKQAADIVLADDNFGTILVAVKEGRRVYDNVQKFVVYLLACNSAEIWCVLMALAMGLPPPLASIHILFANIIADIPPSMSLSMEPEEADLMARRPRRATDRLLDAWNVFFIVMYGLLISVLSLSYYSYSLLIGGSDQDVVELRSESFVCLTVLQLVLAFLSRSLKHSALSTAITSNPYMLLAVSLSMMAMLLGCYVPGLNQVLELRPVGEAAWVRIGGCCVVLVLFSELAKLVRRSIS